MARVQRQTPSPSRVLRILLACVLLIPAVPPAAGQGPYRSSQRGVRTPIPPPQRGTGSSFDVRPPAPTRRGAPNLPDLDQIRSLRPAAPAAPPPVPSFVPPAVA